MVHPLRAGCPGIEGACARRAATGSPGRRCAYAAGVHVASLGLSVLKGAAQDHPASLVLADHGPVDDRRFCCVDPATARVLRTVENPGLLRLRARCGDGTLTVDVPGSSPLTAPVRPAGRLRADYWGRDARLQVLDGPWAPALSAHLGREVVLAQSPPRAVVYGGGVTLVTTSSLQEVARRAGAAADGAHRDALVADAERWRATVVVDTGGAEPFVEDSWVGRRLQVGAVTLRVGKRVPRCAVVRLRPRDGVREDWDPLALLAPDRVPADAARPEVVFGVDAEVEAVGTAAVGDEVRPG
jgi:uncharacterized protein